MKKDLSHIIFALDRSGSMARIWSDTQGGFAQFLVDQKKQPGEALFTLVAFDDLYDVVCDSINIKEIPDDILAQKNISPRGNTALNDAVGKAITTVGEKLANMKEEDRPEHIIVAIMTDGQENASHEYSKTALKELIKQQTDIYKWTFMYMGANVDAFDEASSLGISMNFAANYVQTRGGMKGAMSSYSANVSRSRKGINKGFTSDERDKSMGKSS